MSKKQPLFLDKSVIRELSTIKWPSRPKGILGLASDWAVRCEHDENFPSSRSSSAIYEWLNSGAPAESNAVLGLAAMLDTDPLTIFDFERNGYFSRFTRLREQIYFHIMGGGRFRSILDLMAPREKWPNDVLAKLFYGRPWFASEFEHCPDGLINAYADVHVSFPQSTRLAPRCIHIAYRRANSRDKHWRYYGTIQKFRGKIRLFSESGAYVEDVEVQPSDEELVLKTYFGATHVEFRIASLHEFEHKVVFPSVSGTRFTFEADPRH